MFKCLESTRAWRRSKREQFKSWLQLNYITWMEIKFFFGNYQQYLGIILQTGLLRTAPSSKILKERKLLSTQIQIPDGCFWGLNNLYITLPSDRGHSSALAEVCGLWWLMCIQFRSLFKMSPWMSHTCVDMCQGFVLTGSLMGTALYTDAFGMLQERLLIATNTMLMANGRLTVIKDGNLPTWTWNQFWFKSIWWDKTGQPPAHLRDYYRPRCFDSLKTSGISVFTLCKWLRTNESSAAVTNGRTRSKAVNIIGDKKMRQHQTSLTAASARPERRNELQPKVCSGFIN